MTVTHVYFLGFAGMMAICALTFYPVRDHHEIRTNLLFWTIGCVLVSALWPLVLIAALVAAYER